MAPRRELDDVRDAIRGAGLRATPSRLAVLALLRGQDQPLSHGDVDDRLGDVYDRATLYRNLTDLADAGLVRRSDLGDHVWRFEAIAAGHGADRHPHFVCTGCGVIECLPDVHLAMRRARGPRAVRTKKVEIQLRGLCDACA
jgi:Fur family ferric uptake transcriptional regulator